MNEAQKAAIDAMDYEGMLQAWRYHPAGDPLFRGETGNYFLKRMTRLKKEIGDLGHAAASKRIGWTQDMRKGGRDEDGR